MVGHSPSWFDSNKQPNKKIKENTLVMFPNAISVTIPNHISLTFKSRLRSHQQESKKQKKKLVLVKFPNAN